ncbi:MAG TPA: PatB family C-S lyase, partial [Desulfomonilia bacterium]|nr:PatB family C-S lyase [Desulfomonilia bacterium]
MIKPTDVPLDFGVPVERRNTASLKWDKYKGKDILPLWVADMDFKAPPAVVSALHRHVEHGVFGYTLPPDDLLETVLDMLERMHAWVVKPEWIVWLPGLVTGLNVACRSVGETGDTIMTTIPAYPPFLIAPVLSQRALVTVAHPVDGARYVFDFSGIENSITERTRMFILCNPQNPTGRVFTRDELLRLARICLNRKVIICSDEIHCGLVLDDDKQHIALASLDDEIARNTITLLAPSKTYNLAGLGCSFAVIPDQGLRSCFKNAMNGIVPHVNALGFTAAQAAYRDSEAWRLALIDYLRGNRDLVEDFVLQTPGLGMHHVEATYLAWIDCRELGIDNPVSFFENAGVGLSNGTDFGAPGFVRLNFGCPRSILVEALGR